MKHEQWIIDVGQEVINLSKENDYSVNDAFRDLFDSIIGDYAKSVDREFLPVHLDFSLEGMSPGEIGTFLIRSLQSLGYDPTAESTNVKLSV